MDVNSDMKLLQYTILAPSRISESQIAVSVRSVKVYEVLHIIHGPVLPCTYLHRQETLILTSSQRSFLFTNSVLQCTLLPEPIESPLAHLHSLHCSNIQAREKLQTH